MTPYGPCAHSPARCATTSPRSSRRGVANCQAELGLHLPTKSMLPVARRRRRRRRRCAGSGAPRAETSGCNWLVPEEQTADQRGRCLADSLIRREPDADDTLAREKLVPTARALRRLVYQLADIGLPVDPFWRRDGGLAFDLLSSYSHGRAGDHRPRRTASSRSISSNRSTTTASHCGFGSASRTARCSATSATRSATTTRTCSSRTVPAQTDTSTTAAVLFGDERASYTDAIARHYKFGAPDGWAETYISEYATMHPWEDFAECFAHYLHITDTIDTSREAGMVLQRRPGAVLRTARHRAAGVLRRRARSSACCSTGSGCRCSSTG